MPDSENGTADLLISGGTVVNETGRFVADVAVKDGLIAYVGHPAFAPRAVETLDARGRFVIPGAIDVHVQGTILDADGGVHGRTCWLGPPRAGHLPRLHVPPVKDGPPSPPPGRGS